MCVRLSQSCDIDRTHQIWVDLVLSAHYSEILTSSIRVNVALSLHSSESSYRNRRTAPPLVRLGRYIEHHGGSAITMIDAVCGYRVD